MQLKQIHAAQAAAQEAAQASAQAAAATGARATVLRHAEDSRAVEAQDSFQELREQARRQREDLQRVLREFKQNTEPIRRGP